METITNTIFKDYFIDSHNYDELLSSKMTIKSDWKVVLQNLLKIGPEKLAEKQADINWLLAENGVTYNVYNDPKGLNRPWNLNIVPFIIHKKEWEGVEKGIQQRAELLNLILKDLYGKRELLKNGIIPPEVVYAHSGFLRSCDQINYKNTKQLLIYAADLARGPDGRLWVVNDRTQAPSGMGYALENRFSTSKIVPELYTNINVTQPSNFFNDFNELLINAAATNIESPMVVILTPGPHNETYFEHSYLSSFLGYPLVKGNDLVVRFGKVWLKSLKGLKQVDVILRRIDDTFMDPLELREDSYLGVAGLLEAVRLQNVTIVNPIGSGVLENPALNPFMDKICTYFLNEKLILPQIASWWCGQEKERKHVLSNLPSFVVKRIDRSNREHIYFCEFLDKKALKNLKKEILGNPSKFVAQEKISFSTAPNLVKNQLEPRKILCRTFAISKENSYSVMPGGLVRVAADREELFVSNQRGGTSKDFWVVNDTPQPNLQNYSWNKSSSQTSTTINDVQSSTAENLFWSGRYMGRTLVTARYLRVVLNEMTHAPHNDRKSESESLKILLQSITKITATFPGFIGENEDETLQNPLDEIKALILDDGKIGSFAHAMQSFNNAYYSLRNLWSRDMWRVFEGIQKHIKFLKNEEHYSIYTFTNFFDKIITRLIAFMALTEESILVRQGLLLYFIGLQLEISAMNIEKFRALLIVNYDEELEYDILESLLDSHESLNIYRYSYNSYLSLENVVNLIILDEEYSRSLTYRMKRLKKDIDKLPSTSEHSEELTACQENMNLVISKIESLDIKQLLVLDPESNMHENLDRLLSDLSDMLHVTSLSISDTYFNHSQAQKQLVNRKITT